LAAGTLLAPEGAQRYTETMEKPSLAANGYRVQYICILIALLPVNPSTQELLQYAELAEEVSVE
jgi:hypothetical protein